MKKFGILYCIFCAFLEVLKILSILAVLPLPDTVLCQLSMSISFFSIEASNANVPFEDLICHSLNLIKYRK
jgi:hypothetical protein